MISKIKENNSTGIFWLITLSVLIHLNFIVQPPQFALGSSYRLLHSLLDWLRMMPELALFILYQTLLVLQALRINYLFKTLNLSVYENAVPGMCYILITALIPEWGHISGAFIVNSIVLGILPFLKRIHEKKSAEKVIFNISFALSIAVLLYAPLAPVVLSLLIGIALISSVKINQLLVYILGIATPIYILGCCLFLKDKFPLFDTYLPQWGWYKIKLGADKHWMIIYITLGILFLLGSFQGQMNVNRNPFFARKVWTMIVIQLLLLLAAPFFIRFAGPESWELALLPLSMIISNYFNYVKSKWILRISFWALILVILFNEWQPILGFKF